MTRFNLPVAVKTVYKGYSSGHGKCFVKCFLRVPQAVELYCSCHAAQANKGNFQKTCYKTFPWPDEWPCTITQISLKFLSLTVISNYFAFSGADHDALHRLPRPHILQLLRIPRREGRRATRHPQVRFCQLRRRPLVGSGKSSVDGGISKYPWLITLIWGQDGAAVYQCRPTIGHERTHKIDKRHAPNTLLSYFVEVVLSAN